MTKFCVNLVRYIAPENLPVQYGGLKRENDNEFSTDDTVLRFSVRGGTVQKIKIAVPEVNIFLTNHTESTKFAFGN